MPEVFDPAKQAPAVRRGLASLATLDPGWYLLTTLAGAIAGQFRFSSAYSCRILSWAANDGVFERRYMPLDSRTRVLIHVSPEKVRDSWPALFDDDDDPTPLLLGPVFGEVE